MYLSIEGELSCDRILENGVIVCLSIEGELSCMCVCCDHSSREREW